MAETAPQSLGLRKCNRSGDGRAGSHLDHPPASFPGTHGELCRCQLAWPEAAAGGCGADCCAPAPPVLEFDQGGNLINSWGGPGQGYDWPETNHGIFVDYKGNVGSAVMDARAPAR